MSIASIAQTQAFNAIKKNGQKLTLTRTTPGGYDPVTGASSSTTQTFDFYGIVSRASHGTIQAFDNSVENGTLISTFIRAITAAAKGMPSAPMPGDVVTGIEGETWKVLGSSPESYMGVPITYSLSVKR